MKAYKDLMMGHAEEAESVIISECVRVVQELGKPASGDEIKRIRARMSQATKADEDTSTWTVKLVPGLKVADLEEGVSKGGEASHWTVLKETKTEATERRSANKATREREAEAAKARVRDEVLKSVNIYTPNTISEESPERQEFLMLDNLRSWRGCVEACDKHTHDLVVAHLFREAFEMLDHVSASQKGAIMADIRGRWKSRQADAVRDSLPAPETDNSPEYSFSPAALALLAANDVAPSDYDGPMKGATVTKREAQVWLRNRAA
jgi:hypothetical protein